MSSGVKIGLIEIMALLLIGDFGRGGGEAAFLTGFFFLKIN